MAKITTFGTLKSEILALIGRAPADFVYQVVTREINRDLRLREMQSTTTIAEAATITLPTDFLAMESIYRDVTPRATLNPKSPHVIHSTYQTSGAPTEYAVVDDTLLLNRPGSSENLVLRYYAALTEFSADEDTNDVLARYPGIFLYGALFHHGQGIGDPRTGSWQAAYEGAKAQARISEQNARAGSITPAPTPPGPTP